MYKTTFGPRIQYVLTLTLIFLTLSAWTSGNLFAQEISITVDSNTNASCPAASDGSINISVDGGTPGYTYEWNGPGSYNSTTQDISGLKAGSYTIVVTDDSTTPQSASKTITISDPDNTDPSITAPADIQSDTDSNDCNASSVNLGTETKNDNCGIASVTNDAPSDFPPGETIVTWTVTDNAGNTATELKK